MTDIFLYGSPLDFYLLTAIGAFVLYFYIIKNEARRAFVILGRLSPRLKKSPFIKLVDALLFCFVGAIIGTIVTKPSTPSNALMTGLGWTALIGFKK
jgi:hypothetical protein